MTRHQQLFDRRFSRTLLPLCLAVASCGVVAKADSPRLARPLAAVAAKLEPTRTVVYKRVNGRPLHLHIFEPDGHRASDRRPVFLAIHGGGWTGGKARDFYPFAAHFARLGMVGISLEYRLMNPGLGTTVFECVKDGRSAMRYLRVHACDLGIDRRKIVASGGSAGGHIAAATALFDGIDEEGEDVSVSCMPNALVLYYPVIDTSPDGYGQRKIGERWRELSPVDHVKPRLPPTIVFHGTCDTVTPLEGVKLFHERMRKAGNQCRLVTHPGGRHGYFIFDLKLYAQVMECTEAFLRANGLLVQQQAGNNQ
ncbi:MAG TPA: alpha/beta hydrolase [Planctomycetes bacterium]|nr:alpha/beta hydrolase [Planctomycetota bacterium]